MARVINVSLPDEVYERLQLERGEGESTPGVLRRLVLEQLGVPRGASGDGILQQQVDELDKRLRRLEEMADG